MINYKKLKKQIHRGGMGFVFEVTPEQIEMSDWQMFSVDAVSKRMLLKILAAIIYNKEMDCWKKEFLL